MPPQASQTNEKDQPETLYQQVNQADWFQRILSRLEVARGLQTLFDRECPLELLGCCRVLGIKDASLLVEVNNASQATQLQYRSREVVAALKKYSDFNGLKRITVRVARAS